jgi:hypothetical protein
MLSLLDPLLVEQLELTRRVDVLQALKVRRPARWPGCGMSDAHRSPAVRLAAPLAGGGGPGREPHGPDARVRRDPW